MLALVGVLIAMAGAGRASPVDMCSAFMLAASGVWGGDDAYVTEKGEFWLRRLRVDPQSSRMREWRYRVTLSAATRTELSELVLRHHILGLRDKKRRWIPDEPRVLVGVYPCGKERTSIERSPMDRDIAFAVVRDWFMRQIASAEALPPTL